MSIYQFINEIENGDIVLPAIQRDFVWDTDRITLLFDSIMRGRLIPLRPGPQNVVAAEVSSC